jgi:2,3-bisphosphoglycerate-independent phosphoglycerate mutase
LVYVDPDGTEPVLRSDGALCDVGPMVLDLLGIDVPPEMTGVSLLTL